MWLKHDSGESAELRNQQVLGDDSPLEFDDEGYAEVDNPDAGRKLLAMHRHISPGGHGPDTADEDVDDADETDASDDSGEEFDAAEFVDRTPMDDVVSDIESGEYDDHLDAIEDEASREGVLDAVDERRE